MQRKYPHLKDNDYPYINNVNVFEYKNTFDYSRWSRDSLIKVCNVPWSNDYEHVVKFENDAKRDKYLNDLAGHVTQLKSEVKIMPDSSVSLPIPAPALQLYNYLILDIPTYTTENEQVNFAKPNITRFCYFIDSVEYQAPNATKCFITLDVWATFINSVTINSMMLARGHYPFVNSPLNKYLENPIDNSKYLLAPDVNFGELQKVSSASNLVLNDSVHAIFVTNANPLSAWGSADTQTTPSASAYITDGVLAPFVFAVPVSNLSTFLGSIDSNAPQFKQSVLGVFFAPQKLINLGDSFTFCGATCYRLSALHNVSLDVITLVKNNFNYPDEISEITKLYTFPYAALEIVDEKGNKTLVKIEDTNGAITLNCALDIVFPYINIQGYIGNIGGNVENNISFANVNHQTFKTSGTWYKNLIQWNVPLYQVVQSANKHDEYATYYDRKQAQLAANTAQTNAYNSANTAVTNTGVQTAAASAITANNNAANLTGAGYSNTKMTNDAYHDDQVAGAGLIADIQGAGVASATNTAEAAFSAVIAGSNPIGLASVGIGWAAGQVSTAYQVSKSNVLAVAASENGALKVNDAVTFTNNSTALNNSASLYTTNTNNSTTTTTTANSAALTKTNADNSKTLAENGIANGRAQRSLSAPYTFGSMTNGDTANIKPMLLSANVVTQSESALYQAANEFLRYGYMLNQYIEFGGFNLRDTFTYWQCSDVWLSGSQELTENNKRVIIDVLKNGVTVWNDPNKIGKVSIYG